MPAKRVLNELRKYQDELRSVGDSNCKSCGRHNCWEYGGLDGLYQCRECKPSVGFVTPFDSSPPPCNGCGYMSPKITYSADALEGGNLIPIAYERSAEDLEADIKIVLPEMYPKQKAAFFPENNARIICIEASTKSGKTLGAILWLLRQAFTKGGLGHNFLWVDPYYKTAEDVYRRVKNGLGATGIVRSHDSDLTIELHNGALLFFRSGEKVDTLYGIDAEAAVIDECSRVRREAYTAVTTVLSATGGPLVLIGNVQGRNNWFYSLCRDAENGTPNTSYSKLTANDAVESGVMHDSTLEDAKRLLPENDFRALYMAEAQDDAGNPFGYENIRQCIGPLSDNPPAVFGVDLAKSSDYTVIVGLDGNRQVCFFERFQDDWDVQREFITTNCLSREVTVVIDSTGVGDPIVEQLQKEHYGRWVEGYKFTQESKQKLINGLRMAIQENEVTYPDNEIVTELNNFGYEITRTGRRYEARYGTHDDSVIALALAIYGANEFGLHGYVECYHLGYLSKVHCQSYGIW